jgi:hypothetical protein
MINGDVKQFLDTGWWNGDSTIYYNDHIYFFDGFFDEQHHMHITITKWRAKNIENRTYKNEHDEKGELIDWGTTEMVAPSEDALREEMLKAKFWDGKSFWEVEKELVWVD